MFKKILIILAVLFIFGCAVQEKEFDTKYYSCTSACENSYYARQAISSNNANACSEIEDAKIREECKDSLNYATAMKTQNIVNCDNIKSNSLKDSCKATLESKKIIEQKNPNLCNTLPSKQQDCKDAIYLSKAVEENNILWCNKISDIHQKDICLVEVSLKQAVKEDNEEICSNLEEKNKISCQDRFFYNKARKTKNLELCSKISSNLLREACKSNKNIYSLI